MTQPDPAYLAKHAFQLAEFFNAFYHRHQILSEADEKRKQFPLATVAVVRRELIRTLAVMGITVPPVMLNDSQSESATKPRFPVISCRMQANHPHSRTNAIASCFAYHL